MFKKICIFALFVGLVFSSCDSPLLKSADNADGIEKLEAKATVTGLTICKFLEGKESCCSKETINSFQNATNDKIKNFTKDLGAADKQVETSLSSFVDLQEKGTEFLQLSAEVDSEIDTLDKSLTEEEQVQRRFLQRVMEEVSEIAKQAKTDAEAGVTTVKSNIKKMQKSRKTCVNHGMKVSAKMHCAACDASITFLADGKLKLKTDTCTNLQTNCKELLEVKTDDSNESPQMLKNSEFMKKYFEHKKKSFNESNTLLKEQKTLLKGLQSKATAQKATVKKALKIKMAGEGDIKDLLKTGAGGNLDLDQAKAKLKAVLALKKGMMINAGTDTAIDAMTVDEARAKHLEIKNANKDILLSMVQKYARNAANYADRSQIAESAYVKLYEAVNADASALDLAAVQAALKNVNTKAQELLTEQMSTLDTDAKIDAIETLQTLVDQLKILAENKKEEALNSYQYIDFQILKGDGTALKDLELSKLIQTAEFLKLEREAVYDEVKIANPDIDGKTDVELKANIDQFALAFKANVENAIAQSPANKADLEAYLLNFSYTENDDLAALQTKVRALYTGKDHAIDVPDFSSETVKSNIEARLGYQQTFLKTLMDKGLDKKPQVKTPTSQEKINLILEEVDLAATDDVLKAKLIEVKAVMETDQQTKLGDVEDMTAEQRKEKLKELVDIKNAHKVKKTVMDIDFETMSADDVKKKYDEIKSLLTEKDVKMLELGESPDGAAIKTAMEKWQNYEKEQMMPNKQDQFGWGKGKTQARSKAAKVKVDDVFTKFSEYGSDEKEKKEWSDSMANFTKLNTDLDSKVALDTTQFKSMKVKKTKLPTGCSEADACQALCDNIITKKGIDIDALSRGGAVEEEVEGNVVVGLMEGSDSEERLLSTGDVVFAEDGADVTAIVTDMTLDEVTENPGDIKVDNPPAVNDGTTNTTDNGNTTNTTNNTNDSNVNNSNNTTNTTDPNTSGLKMSVSLVLAAFALVALFWN